MGVKDSFSSNSLLAPGSWLGLLNVIEVLPGLQRRLVGSSFTEKLFWDAGRGRTAYLYLLIAHASRMTSWNAALRLSIFQSLLGREHALTSSFMSV